MRRELRQNNTHILYLLILASCSSAHAEESKDAHASDIAKKTQNPGAVLVSVPFQFNFNGDIGANDRTQMLLNIQPVLPVTLTPKLALITRWVTPVISQPDVASTTGSTFGLGDINPQIFVAESLPGGITAALGTSIILPTATDAVLGQGKLSAGPSLVGVYSHGPLVTGALLIADFSVAGDSNRRGVGVASAQPFFNYNFSTGIYAVSSPTYVRDWKAGTWTAPVGGGFGKVFMFGATPVNLSAQGYWNVVSPSVGSSWQFRFSMQFVYPQAASTR